ncbi:hypothetical protein [Bradyrhizobium sp.]|uniref:hypothetical protein n=1 Tax=Bradyrhizobium sp. TaxID=376 RepID=UPI00345CAB00
MARHFVLLLPLALAGCMDSDETRSTSFVEDSNAVQPFPTNHRTELVAFMHTYLNDPAAVRAAEMADPVQRVVGGRNRYVSCLRFAARESDGTYRDPRVRAVVYVDGRLDRIAPNPGDLCAGAAYGPFPELEKMSR